jgi:hypothetical protein
MNQNAEMRWAGSMRNNAPLGQVPWAHGDDISDAIMYYTAGVPLTVTAEQRSGKSGK